MQKAMAFLNAALDVLRDVLLPVTDLLVGLFTEPKKTWDDFYNNTLVPIGNYFKDLYTIVLGNLVKGFNNTLIGINKLRIGFNEFMGDEEEAEPIVEAHKPQDPKDVQVKKIRRRVKRQRTAARMEMERVRRQREAQIRKLRTQSNGLPLYGEERGLVGQVKGLFSKIRRRRR